MDDVNKSPYLRQTPFASTNRVVANKYEFSVKRRSLIDHLIVSFESLSIINPKRTNFTPTLIGWFSFVCFYFFVPFYWFVITFISIFPTNIVTPESNNQNTFKLSTFCLFLFPLPPLLVQCLVRCFSSLVLFV